MAHVTGTDLYDLQYDSLFQTTNGNPQLPASVVDALNKALNTDNKQIIKAINEILKKSKTTDNNFVTFSSYYNTLIGDAVTNTQLKTDLSAIDQNIIKAICKTYVAIYGDLNTPKSIPIGYGTSLVEAIQNIVTKLNADNTIDGGTF